MVRWWAGNDDRSTDADRDRRPVSCPCNLRSVIDRPSVVSLFSGAGGLDIGLERSGWHIRVATDLDPAAISTLRASQDAEIPVEGQPGRVHQVGTKIIQADIRELAGADLRPDDAQDDWRPDLLAGGPPCQPWSSGGLQRGFMDSRGMLMGQMIRLTDELRPRYVLMENVRGLLTATGSGGAHGEAIRVLQAEWEQIGYAVRWGLLSAADFGAAQRRVRLVMMATADRAVPELPRPTHAKTGWDLQPWLSLGDFLAGRPEPDAADVVLPSGPRAVELLALWPGHGIRTGGTVEHQRPGGHWGYRQDSFLADLAVPARTIRAASTPDWVRLPHQPMRRLTWRECAALQGFPDEWQFAGSRDVRFRLIGNAVQTDMATALGLALREALDIQAVTEAPISPDWPTYFARRIRGAAADHRANEAARIRHRRLAKAS